MLELQAEGIAYAETRGQEITLIVFVMGCLGGPFIKNLLTLILDTSLASLVAQRVKRLPEMYETWVRSLGQEDPLEKEMATHSSTLAWKTPWTEEPGGLQSMRWQRVGHG